MFYAIGDRLFSLLAMFYELAGLAGNAALDCAVALRHRLRPVLSVYLRQVYFTGWEAMKVILPTSLLIGTAAIVQIVSITGAGNEYLIGKIMVWVLVRELAPIFTAIILAARSGAAIAAELAQMKLGGEIELLEDMGIPAARYLIMPRIAGFITAMVALTVYFDLVGVLGSLALASIGWHVPLEQYTEGLVSVLSIGEFLVSLAKTVLVGLVVATLCCREGLRVYGSVTRIPMAASRAVMQSIVALFLLNGLISMTLLLV
jgi:phospholipid/cholesterol/gamma-HCH transport system permease protein